MIASYDYVSEDQKQVVPIREKTWDVEVFYDGDCPLCKREIDFIRHRDDKGKIEFTDIADAKFDALQIGKTHAELMAQIHGRLSDGRIIVGPEVFRRLYGAIGFSRLVSFSRMPLISQTIELAYRCFARYRLPLTGRRCTDQTCDVR